MVKPNKRLVSNKCLMLTKHLGVAKEIPRDMHVVQLAFLIE